MRIGAPLPALHIDQEYMKRAVYNLIENAVKYSEEAALIAIDVVKKGAYVEISVNDQGHGIPEKELGQIFERFYRVDRSRNSKIPGSGLGLAIVKEIVSAHNGEISVTSDVGKGSTFIITLPVEETIC